jgi:hypothetical protein
MDIDGHVVSVVIVVAVVAVVVVKYKIRLSEGTRPLPILLGISTYREGPSEGKLRRWNS